MIIHKTRRFKVGYLIHHGEWQHENDEPTPMKWATNYNGDYIGSSRDAHYLCAVLGIKPEARKNKTVCSVGFCEKESKWYGWSHRAIARFDSYEEACEFASSVS